MRNQTRLALATLPLAATLWFAGFARADYVPGPCTGGIAGVICAPGEWTQPGYVESAGPNPYLSIEEHGDEFAPGSDNSILTVWFRSDQAGVPDQGYQYTVGDWRTVSNGVITPPIQTGHTYTAWATLDSGDGNGPMLVDIAADGGNNGSGWAPTALVYDGDPNQVGGPMPTTCITAADPTQEGNTLGCAEASG